MAGERILLVDTEKNVLLMYQAILREEGYVVDTAITEQEAIEKIAGGNFYVLITELYLKDRATTGIIKHVKQNYPDVYIIMISAASLNPESYEKIIGSGVDDYFTKPFSPHALLANIKKGLRRRQVFIKNRELETRLQHIDQHSYSYDALVRETIKPIFNKSYFSTMLQHEIIRAKRYNHSFSLITLDINPNTHRSGVSLADRKQGITDELSNILMNNTRKTDIITIYNGTIALILVETSKDGTLVFQTRLQKEIEHNAFKNDDAKLFNNIRIDFLTYPEQSQAIEQWMEGITRPL